MTAALCVFAGGACGAMFRALAALCFPAKFPLAIFGVNMAGSFLAGLFTAGALSPEASAALITGFCGGLTTYSTFALQTTLMWRQSPVLALANVAFNVACGVLCAVAGWLLGGRLGGG